MNMKLNGIVAACMLAMVAIAPMGLSHTDVPDLINGTCTSSSLKPTGNAVGAAAPSLQLIAPPTVDDAVSVGNGLYDMEVVTGANDGTNEFCVDGVFTGALNNRVPEGTFNDGGFGAVGHTTNVPGYVSWGCGYGTATVTATPGPSVWATTTCDWGHFVGGNQFDPTPLPGVDAYQDCAVNQAVLGNLGTPGLIPGAEVGCATDLATYAQGWVQGPDGNLNTADDGVPVLVECVKEIVGPVVFPTHSCPLPTGATFKCHNTVASPGQTGQGSEDSASGYDVVAWPAVPSSGPLACPGTSGVAVLFVFNSVTVDLDGVAPDYTGKTTAVLTTVS